MSSKDKDKMVGLRLPDDLYDAVAREAEITGNSMQSIIRSILARNYGQLPMKAGQTDGTDGNPVDVR